MPILTHDPEALSKYGREGYFTPYGYATPGNNLTTGERERHLQVTRDAYHLEHNGFWFRNKADRYAFQILEAKQRGA